MAAKKTEVKSVDLFSGAIEAAPVFKVKKSSGKGEREEVNLGEDLDCLAAIEVMIKALQGIGEQLEGELKERAYGIYADKAVTTKKHPSSFLAVGEVATASVEMRKRASNHPINEEMLEQIQNLGIPLSKNIKVPERFIFNSDLLQQPAIRQAIGEAIAAHPVLAPIAGTLAQKQAEEYSWVTTDQTLPAAAQLLNIDNYKLFVPYLSSLAIGKYHLNGETISQGERGEGKQVTQSAKATAVAMLQDMGVLPPQTEVSDKRKK